MRLVILLLLQKQLFVWVCYSQGTHLRQHMHMHAGTKPYSCEVCGKGYSGGLDLRNHYTRVHGLEVIATKVVKRNKYTVNIPTSAAATLPAVGSSHDAATADAAAAADAVASIAVSDVLASIPFDPTSSDYSIVHHDVVASVLAHAALNP